MTSNDKPTFLKRYKKSFFYLLTILGFGGLIYLIIRGGSAEEHATVQIPAASPKSFFEDFKATNLANLHHPLALLLMQIITIIIVGKIFSYLFQKIRQPTVIGEIVAGIVLGPSVAGLLFPEFSAYLFPSASLGNLQFLSQIGLILFMFVVGMELDINLLKKKAKDAVIISHASIIFPFTLGVGLAYFYYGAFAPDNISFLSFALFIGISMSITAFPVLARIVQERGLTKTKLGVIAITCAAADDITAWCLLAAVIAIVKAGSFLSSLLTIVTSVLYVFAMLKLVRPFLSHIGDKYSNRESLSRPVVGIFFIVLLISSFFTEVIGIHALFGAFMAGVVMPPNNRFRNIFIEKVEDISLVLLLPLFFVFTGLRTQIGLLNEGHLWVSCFLIVLVAVTGKFAGSALAARFVGQSWRDSLIIGALMNTRGLMELVVLNIGYDLGVLSPEIFAMLVLMALVTTFMTTPAINLIRHWFAAHRPVPQTVIGEVMKFRILISFGSPQKGVSMLRLANGLIQADKEHSDVTALHLSPSNEINQYNFAEYEKESFRHIKLEARKLDLKLNLLFKPSQEVESEIVQIANDGSFDLLLVGVGKSVYSGSVLGRVLGVTSRIINPSKLYDTLVGRERIFDKHLIDEKVKTVLKSATVPVGVLLDKRTESFENIFFPVYFQEDLSLLPFIRRFIVNSGSKIVFLDSYGAIEKNLAFKQAVFNLEEEFPESVEMLEGKNVNKAFINEQNLIVLSSQGLIKLANEDPAWLSAKPAVLIIKKP